MFLITIISYTIIHELLISYTKQSLSRQHLYKLIQVCVFFASFYTQSKALHWRTWELYEFGTARRQTGDAPLRALGRAWRNRLVFSFIVDFDSKAKFCMIGTVANTQFIFIQKWTLLQWVNIEVCRFHSSWL